MGRAAQQVIRRHAIVIAGAAHKAQPRFPRAILVVAQQRLADAQIRRRLPLADVASLPQGGKGLRKITFHGILPFDLITGSII